MTPLGSVALLSQQIWGKCQPLGKHWPSPAPTPCTSLPSLSHTWTPNGTFRDENYLEWKMPLASKDQTLQKRMSEHADITETTQDEMYKKKKKQWGRGGT